jgi:hypothetical protein
MTMDTAHGRILCSKETTKACAEDSLDVGYAVTTGYDLPSEVSAKVGQQN